MCIILIRDLGIRAYIRAKILVRLSWNRIDKPAQNALPDREFEPTNSHQLLQLILTS